jgi:hypothetical protein
MDITMDISMDNYLDLNAYTHLMESLTFDSDLPSWVGIRNPEPIPARRVDCGSVARDGDIEIDSSACFYLVLWMYSRLRIYACDALPEFPNDFEMLRRVSGSRVDTTASPADVENAAHLWNVKINFIEPGLEKRVFNPVGNGDLTVCNHGGHFTLVREDWHDIFDVTREMRALCARGYPKYV